MRCACVPPPASPPPLREPPAKLSRSGWMAWCQRLYLSTSLDPSFCCPLPKVTRPRWRVCSSGRGDGGTGDCCTSPWEGA